MSCSPAWPDNSAFLLATKRKGGPKRRRPPGSGQRRYAWTIVVTKGPLEVCGFETHREVTPWDRLGPDWVAQASPGGRWTVTEAEELDCGQVPSG